ncbi:polysaccharide pyruvyl transferase family protein [Formosa sp. A9]|uniref:polysaccharide pyruvyl transferase family protein n=1 Tax=Formosa sp. A9 TaxID=3442641 RepID=UPI003EBFD95D
MSINTAINILGAYDRHNYGDLLFPIILQNFLKDNLDNEKYSINIYAILESDLSSYGALKTKRISDLYESMKGDSSVLIVAGGDVLTAQWASVLLALDHPGKVLMKGGRVTSRLFNRNKLAKYLLGGKSDWPFVIKKSDFQNLKALLYNSVGGTNYHKFANLFDGSLFGDYFSVRDEIVCNSIKKQYEAVKLVPDSAIIMSEFYPLDTLKTMISSSVSKFAQEQSYVFFQINRTLARGKETELAQILKSISEKFNLKICLCPIGRANKHEDHVPLQDIHAMLETQSFYIDHPSIWDTMFLIANSRMYIGTSLHGAITAMSYNVPYMGIEVTKLNQYLKTWSVEPLNKTFKINNILNNFNEIINVDKELLKQSRDKQIQLVKESFDNMIRIIKD